MRNWHPGLPAVSREDGKRQARSGLRQKLIGWLTGGRSRRRAPAAGTLEHQIASLNSRQKDMAFLSHMAQLLQACRSLEEMCKVARDQLQGLSPQLSGALYLMAETQRIPGERHDLGRHGGVACLLRAERLLGACAAGGRTR